MHAHAECGVGPPQADLPASPSETAMAGCGLPMPHAALSRRTRDGWLGWRSPRKEAVRRQIGGTLGKIATTSRRSVSTRWTGSQGCLRYVAGRAGRGACGTLPEGQAGMPAVRCRRGRQECLRYAAGGAGKDACGTKTQPPTGHPCQSGCRNH